MNDFFAALGRTVFRQWKEKDFSLLEFPKIAQAALTRSPLARHLSVPSLISEFLLNDEQAWQTSSGFGQPEIVVFDDPKFYIQVLFWLDGTTQIHQHEFSGAFHVLEGSSIHTSYQFENVQPISAHFRLGDLRRTATQFLKTGSTVPIVSGSSCIHSLFHLDTPSLTVVIRTHTDPGSGPQFTYLPPHVAVDPFVEDSLTARRTQLLDVLAAVHDASYPDLVSQMLAELDFERGFFVLQNCLDYLRTLERWDDVYRVFRRKHGSKADRIRSTLDEMVRRDTLIGARRSIQDPERRFFLALLLNLDDRKSILQFVGARFPDARPAETILRWTEELITEDGVVLFDPEFSDELQMDPEPFLKAFQYFLSNPKKMPNGLTQRDVDRFRAAVLQSGLQNLLRY